MMDTVGIEGIAEDAYGVIESHGFNVERGKDGLFVGQRGIVARGDFRGQDHAPE